jgi:hypothetical protein
MNSRYREHILRSYKSVAKPDYGFFAKLANDPPYGDILASIAKFATVTDDTVPDDDVSFSYIIHSGEKLWYLQLSAVGPFVALFSVPRGGRPTPRSSWRIVEPDRAECEVEDLLVRHLVSAGFHIVSAADLQQEVEFNLVNNDGPVTLYQVLFRDDDVPGC